MNANTNLQIFIETVKKQTETLNSLINTIDMLENTINNQLLQYSRYPFSLLPTEQKNIFAAIMACNVQPFGNNTLSGNVEHVSSNLYKLNGNFSGTSKTYYYNVETGKANTY